MSDDVAKKLECIGKVLCEADAAYVLSKNEQTYKNARDKLAAFQDFLNHSDITVCGFFDAIRRDWNSDSWNEEFLKQMAPQCNRALERLLEGRAIYCEPLREILWSLRDERSASNEHSTDFDLQEALDDLVTTLDFLVPENFCGEAPDSPDHSQPSSLAQGSGDAENHDLSPHKSRTQKTPWYHTAPPPDNSKFKYPLRDDQEKMVACQKKQLASWIDISPKTLESRCRNGIYYVMKSPGAGKKWSVWFNDKVTRATVNGERLKEAKGPKGSRRE